MRLEHKAVVLLCLVSAPTWADSFTAKINNSTAQLEGGLSASGSPAEYRAGAFYNDQGTVLANVGILAGGGDAEGAANKPKIGGGVKAIMGNMNQNGVKETVGCIALGGQIGFAFPAKTSSSLVASIYNSLKMSAFMCD